MGGSVGTLEKNAEALVVAGKEIRLEVNVGETEYMVLSRDQDAGRSHSINVDSCYLEMTREYKYLGEKINKSKFYSGRN